MQSKDTYINNDGLPIHFQQAPGMGSPDGNVFRNSSSELVMWRQLQMVGSKIEGWRFVAEYDDLPSIIWESWKHHRSAGTTEIFMGWLRGEIKQGEQYVGMLLNTSPKEVDRNVDLQHWSVELAELLSKVHRSISALEVRLDMVESGLVRKYPQIICPQHL
jgi:hypothetical protein